MKLTPRHRAYIDKLVSSKIHILATARGADEYVQEKDDRGKTTVKKVGVGAKQRNGFEYEFTCTFLLDQQTNTSSCQKDNTHLFENKTPWALTERDGVNIIKWCNTSKIEEKEKAEPKKATSLSLGDTQQEVLALCKEHGGSKNPELVSIIKKYEQTGNPLKIEDVDDLIKLKKEIEEIK